HCCTALCRVVRQVALQKIRSCSAWCHAHAFTSKMEFAIDGWIDGRIDNWINSSPRQPCHLDRSAAKPGPPPRAVFAWWGGKPLFTTRNLTRGVERSRECWHCKSCLKAFSPDRIGRTP